ncbi:MAG: hypothetical protein BalsKO_09780 [Balneolaceae bacterium]
MAQRNSYRKNNSKDHFDLDNYINEKSNPEVDSSSQPVDLEKKSSWLKNSVLIFGLALITLLYFNNWSPKQVYGNIFGIEESQTGSEGPVIVSGGNLTSEELEATIAGLAKLEELKRLEQLGGLANLEALEGLESLEALEGLENLEVLEGLESLENLESLEGIANLSELESSLEGLENLEEMNELRTFALETAMEALNSIGESEEFGEAVGNAAQLGIQEALKELENLRSLEVSSSDQVARDAASVNTSLVEYSTELSEAGISEVFNSSDVQKLHQANIPSSFLQQLDDLNLLEKLDTDSIIEAYKGRE